MDSFKSKVERVLEDLKRELTAVKGKKDLEDVKARFLGRKQGKVTKLFEEMRAMPSEEKPEAGQILNTLKIEVQEKIQVTEGKFLADLEVHPEFDLTLPGRTRYRGAPHPLILFQEEIEAIFLGMGFSIAEGPEIETDYYNFEALNFPPHHPARDDWDSLYINDKLLLRTHTSPMQIRTMEKQKPPIQIIIPGRVFRNEAIDPTHLPMFYQVEGLVVDEGVTFAHLKGTLEYFLRALFGEKTKIRFRPSFFPFTEPSAEVDIECLACRGKNAACPICGGSGWKELLGAGMVDPQVFKNVNIDPERYTGWAFGLGIDRTAMFCYGISDIRTFYENDLRFIRQFNLK
jgi:phenylalanyl-tRNA synthetase alpha chain